MNRLLPSTGDAAARWFGLGVIVVLTLLVEVLVRTSVINPHVVPLPSDVILALHQIVVDEGALPRFADTGLKALTSVVLITAVGVPFGLLLFRKPLLRRSYESWIAGLAAAPIVLLYPLFLVIYGRSAWTVIMISVVSGIAPVILKTIEGLSGVRTVLLQVGRSMRMTPWQQFRLVMLPAALPTIFVGIRLGIIVALVNVVGVEYLINLGGLGALINELAERYDPPATYAAILFVVMVSVLVFVLVERAEQWLKRT